MTERSNGPTPEPEDNFEEASLRSEADQDSQDLAERRELIQKVTQATENFQIVNGILSSYFSVMDEQTNGRFSETERTHPNRWAEPAKVLASVCTGIRGLSNDGPKYCGSRNDVANLLAPHSGRLLSWLNHAVNSYESALVNVPIAWTDSMKMPKPNMHIIPAKVVDAVVRLQKSKEQEFVDHAKALYETLKQKGSDLTEGLEYEVDAAQRVYARAMGKLEAAFDDSVIPGLVDKTRQVTKQVKDKTSNTVSDADKQELKEIKDRAHRIHEFMDQQVFSGAPFLSPDQLEIFSAFKSASMIVDGMWRNHYRNFKIEPNPNSVADRGLMKDFRLREREMLREEREKPKEAMEASAEALFDVIIDAAWELNQLHKGMKVRSALKGFLSTWLLEPDATQHVEYMFTKLFEDPELLNSYPNLVGQGLVRIPDGVAIDVQKAFPPEVLAYRSTRCGGGFPRFEYLQYAWGVGVSVHFPQVAD